MKSDTITARASKRRKHARNLLDEHLNDWDGSASIEELVAHPWAIVIARDQDSWVQPIAGAEDIAGYELQCCRPDGDEAEYVEGVYDLDTGEPVTYTARATVTVTMADGTMADVEGDV